MMSPVTRSSIQKGWHSQMKKNIDWLEWISIVEGDLASKPIPQFLHLFSLVAYYYLFVLCVNVKDLPSKSAGNENPRVWGQNLIATRTFLTADCRSAQLKKTVRAICDFYSPTAGHRLVDHIYGQWGRSPSYNAPVMAAASSILCTSDLLSSLNICYCKWVMTFLRRFHEPHNKIPFLSLQDSLLKKSQPQCPFNSSPAKFPMVNSPTSQFLF